MSIELPRPGSAGFSPALVAAVAGAPELAGWALDAALVAVFLMALIVREGGVIFDVRRAGIARVEKVAVALAESVFGFETRTIHLTSASTASDLTIDPVAEAVVITGIENARAPVHIKLRSELARAEMERPDGRPFVIWVRDEDRDDAPTWLLDLFACSTPVAATIPTPPIGLPKKPLVPPSYIADLRSLLLVTWINPPLEIHISNLVAALVLHPLLVTNMTARATACLTAFVRAHRLLAAPFTLPENWQSALGRWRAEPGNTWDPGPFRLELTSSHQPQDHAAAGTGFGGGPGGVATWATRAGEIPNAAAMLGPGAEDWYCLPANVAGAWELAVRHRCRLRGPGEASLYALNHSAESRVAQSRKAGDKTRDTARRKRDALDDALEEIVLTV